MAVITFDKFDGGLDWRKAADTAEANRLRVLTNAYVTTGKEIRKRPGLSLQATLEPGTVGLFAANGVLNTFTLDRTLVHADPLFAARFVPHPTNTAVSLIQAHFADKFQGYIYAAVEYSNADVFHHYLDDPGPWTALAALGAIVAWAPNTAYAAGNSRQPTTPNGFRYKCSMAGTSDPDYEPNWPTVIGQTIVDGSVTWKCNVETGIGSYRRPTVPNGYRYEVTTAGNTGAGEPAWPTVVGNTVVDGTVTWTCRAFSVRSGSCPQSKSVVKQKDKLFAIDGETVGFCATADARNWTAHDDAGFLATGLQQTGAEDAQAVAGYRDKLAVYFVDGVQIWDTDPDPDNIVLNQRIFNLGTRYRRSPITVMDDIFYLSDAGYRSITVSAINADNFQDADIGTPIDSLVAPLLTTSINPISVYYPRLGQFWSIIGNLAFVYTFSRTSKVSAWSMFTFPFSIEAAAQLNGELYLRCGDLVYRVNSDAYTDAGTVIQVEVELPYLNCKAPGVLKMFNGVDSITEGSSTLYLRFDPRDENMITGGIPISGNSQPGPLTPVELCAVQVAPRWVHAANEPWVLSSFSLHFEMLNAA